MSKIGIWPAARGPLVGVRRGLLAVLFCWTVTAQAVSIGPQVPLAPFRSYVLAGDVIVRGVGMRNRGGGTIDIAVPPGATVVGAFLYWSLIAPEEPDASGTFNGQDLVGELIGETGSACWPTLNDANADPPTAFTFVFRADVTKRLLASNTLAGLPSGLTGGQSPTAPGATGAYPLLDGASLVVVYSLSGDLTRNIAIYDGARTFFSEVASTTISWGAPGALAPVAARTIFAVADGQSFFPSDQAAFNGTVVAGPGGALRPTDAFDGTDGGGAVAPHGLWDTLDADVSGAVAPGATEGIAQVVSGDKFDCLTWFAQVASVVTGLPPTTLPTTTTLSSTSTTTGTGPTSTSTTTTTTTTTTVTITTTTILTTTTTTSSTTTTSTTTTTSSTTTTTTSSTTTTTATTTTATTEPTTSTTTTSTTSSTTTTTLESPGCDGPRAATYESIRCRLRELGAIIANVPELDPYERLLGRRVTRSGGHVDRSETYHLSGRDRPARSRLRAAIRGMIAIGYRIDSLGGKGNLSPVVRDDLRRRADELRDDMRALGLLLGDIAL